MEDRTVSDYSELRRLAEAATPGPWYVQKGRSNETCGYVTRDPIEQYQRSITGWGAVEHRFEDAAYIAAASPDVVLGLLSDLAAANRRAEEAERERDAARAEAKALRSSLEDFRDRGCRHDLNPTMVGEWDSSQWHRYIASMDRMVRERAAAALRAASSPSAARR
jgi:hypothetical protein